MQGLYLDNLIGVIKDASSLSRSLRNHGSIRVFPDRNKEGKEFALVEFLKTEDGFYASPVTELAEKDMTYFIVKVANTYKGSTLIVKDAESGKPGNVKTDKRGIQRCNIRGNGIVIRVSQRGHVEIYYVTAPTENNRKKVKCRTLYEGTLLFNNPSLLNADMEDNEYLSKYAEDIKEAYKQINKQDGFENKMDLERFRKNEKTETPPVDVEPEIDNKDKGKGKDVRKPKNETEKSTSTSKKIRNEEIIKDEAEEEIKDSTVEDETSDEKSKEKTEKKTDIELARDPLTQKLAIPVKTKDESKGTKATKTKPKKTKTKTTKK